MERTEETPEQVEPEGKGGGREEEAEPDDAATAAELAAIAVDDGKGNKMVPLSALIGIKKEARGLTKRNKELEAKSAHIDEVEKRLANVQPIIDAVVNDPKLRAAAMAKTRPSGEFTDQPSDDAEAKEWADINQLYTEDDAGKSVLDVARARRQIDIIDKRSKRHAGEAMAPIARMTFGSRAEQAFTQAVNATDDAGTPVATRESIEETFKQLPPELLSNPEVVDYALTMAAGLDRRKGRTPKAPDASPLFFEPSGGRRRTGEAFSESDKQMATKVGLTDKELKTFGGRAPVNRRGEIDLE